LVAANQLERAKQVFQQLVDREPESEPAKRKLNDVLRKMGLLAPEEGAAIVFEDELPTEIVMPPAPKLRPGLEPPPPQVTAKPVAAAPAIAVEVPLDEDTQKFIAQSLTDVDLFASYGLTQKAIGLLEAILRRAPRHTPTLEKLLDFVLGAGDDRRTAELAAQLEQIHTERGDERGAERFGELRRRFQRAAGLTDEELALPGTQVRAAASEVALPEVAVESESELSEFSIEEAAPEADVTPAPAVEPEAVHEVDLSQEWASVSEEVSPAGASVPSEQAAPEFEIHAEAPVEEQESTKEFAIAQPSTPAPEKAPEFAEFEIDAEAPSVEEESPAAEISARVPAAKGSAEEIHEEVLELPSIFEEERAKDAEEVPAPAAALPDPPATKSKLPATGVAPVTPKTPEPEFELDQDYELVLDPEALVPAYDQKPPETPIVALEPEPEPVAQNVSAPPPASGFASDQFLSDLANEIDQLGIGGLTPAFSEPAKAEASAAGKNAARAQEKTSVSLESGPLKEVFDEFRAELGEMGAEEEDLETHYNLGVAFREMGLLEEAISEFQKVAKASERGRDFRYAMQCCTLLGLAFMDKGQPSIAAIWYERALHTPDIEAESILALQYDLGVAQESAGESEAALKSFSQVYAVNIDYRDVGERIAALQKPAR
jgi:hypothetical protein